MSTCQQCSHVISQHTRIEVLYSILECTNAMMIQKNKLKKSVGTYLYFYKYLKK